MGMITGLCLCIWLQFVPGWAMKHLSKCLCSSQSHVLLLMIWSMLNNCPYQEVLWTLQHKASPRSIQYITQIYPVCHPDLSSISPRSIQWFTPQWFFHYIFSLVKIFLFNDFFYFCTWECKFHEDTCLAFSEFCSLALSCFTEDSLQTTAWPWIHYVIKASLDLPILPPLHPKFWNYRHETPCPTTDTVLLPLFRLLPETWGMLKKILRGWKTAVINDKINEFT